MGDRIDPGPLIWRQAVAGLAGCLAAIVAAVLAGLSPLAAAQLCLLASLMAPIAVTDYFTYRVPDGLVLATIASGFGFGFAEGGWMFLLEAALRMALIGVALLALREIYFRWRGFDGLGLGDVKLIAAAGAWIDLVGLVNAILFAALAALATAGLIASLRGWDGAGRLPFATFLAPSIVVTWLLAHW